MATAATTTSPAAAPAATPPMGTPVMHIPTQFESCLCANGFVDTPGRQALANALSQEAIGISTIASVAGWEYGALTVSASFPTAMAKLVSDIQGVNGALLASASDKVKLTASVRMALEGEGGIHKSGLTHLGMLPAVSQTQVVLGGDQGDLLGNKAKIEELIKMDAVISAYALPSGSMPTYKIISYFIRGLESNPPAIWWYKLDMAICQYEAQQRAAPLRSKAEELVKRPTEYDDIKPIALTSKLVVINQIKLIMSGLAIASSIMIADADLKTRYTGSTKYNIVKYCGVDTVFYGTRFMVEAVLEWVFRYGENLTTNEIVVAFNETLRAAGTYVSQGYLVNQAIVMGLQDSKEDWKGARRIAPKEDLLLEGGRPKGGPSRDREGTHVMMYMRT